MKSPLATASILTLCTATASLADVTAEEVWAAEVALYEASGFRVTATPQRAGQTLTVPEVGLDYPLPMDIGSLLVRFGPVILTETGDGAVTMTYGDGTAITAAFTTTLAAGLDTFVSGEIVTTLDNYSARATGTPGDILWDVSADAIIMALGSLRVEGAAELDPGAVSARVGLAGYRAQNGIRHDATQVAYSNQTTIAETVTDFLFDMNGTESRSISASYDASSEATIILPVGGYDLLNLGPALRAGLSIDVGATGGQSVSQTVARAFGETVSEDAQTLEAIRQTLRLDAGGLMTQVDVEGAGFDVAAGVDLPFPVSARIEAAGFRLLFPLLASEAPQDWAFGFGIEGATVTEDLWRMLDPRGSVPHDPVTFALDLSGTMDLGTDLTDFLALPEVFEAAAFTGVFPLMPRSVTINRAAVAGVGAAATATGTFELPEDPVMFEGLPLPVGQARAIITGANGLIDRLSGMGLMSEDELLGFRLGLGFIGRVTGDDEITSEVTIGPDGGISLNGMRIR